MNNQFHVLIVEDNPGDVDLIQEMLYECSLAVFQFHYVSLLEEAKLALSQKKYNIIILDLGLPDSSGMDSLYEMINHAPDTAIVVMTGNDDEETGLKAVQCGAQDYLIKGHIDFYLFPRIILHSIERKKHEVATSHLNKILKSIRNVNQIIVQEKNKQIMIEDICRELSCYSGVWIALTDQDNTEVLIAASSGLKKNLKYFHNQLQNNQLSSCMRKAANDSSIVTIRNPEKECINCPLMEDEKDNSVMITEIKYNKKRYGFFSCSVPNHININDEEKYLFKEVAEDIAFALHDNEMEKIHWQMQKTIKKSEEKYRLLAENTIDCIWMMNLNLDFTYINQAIYHMTGYTPEEWVKTNLRDHCEKATITSIFNMFKGKKLNSNNNKFKIELISYKKDGTPYFAEVLGKMVMDIDGHPSAIQGVTREITKRKKTEKKLNQYKNRLESTMLAGNIAWWEMDIKSGSISFNRNKTKMLGYDKNNFNHYNDFMNIVHPDDYNKTMNAMKEHLNGQAARYEVSYRIRSKGGSYLWFKDIGGIIERDNNGFPLKVGGIVLNITEEKKSEEKLKETLNIISKSSVVAITWRNEQSWPVVFVSDNVEKLFGYTAEEFISGKVMYINCIHPEDLNRVMDEVLEYSLNESNEFEHIPYRIITRNKKIKIVKDWTFIERNEKNDILYYKGVVEDITDQIKAENDLKESEEKYRLLFSEMIIGFVLFEIVFNENNQPVDLRFIEMNKKFEAITGLKAAECLNKLYTELMTSIDDDWRVLIINVALSREPLQTNGYFEQFQKYLEIRFYSPNINRVAGMFFDRTFEMEAHNKLRKSEKNYRELYESMMDAYVKVNINDQIIEFNDTFKKLLEYSDKELSNLTYKDITPDNWHDKEKNIFIKEILANGYSNVYEKEFISRSGKIIPVELRSYLITNKNDEPEYIWAIIRDISEKKKADMQLQQYREHLEELVEERTSQLENVNRELKEFAYVVSHDLKAPLRGISKLSHWLHNDYFEKLDEEGKENLNLIINRVRRMENLIEGILQYSRIGRINFELQECDLNDIITDIIDFLSPPDNMTITIKDELPKVFCQKIRIEQVFQNIISNAIKYNDKSEGLIEIHYKDNGDNHQFSIKDNGPGIDMKYKEKVFQIFQTLNPRDKVESTGIGLTIVKKIINQNGGEIYFESKLGKGTTFIFCIPKKEKAIEKEFTNIAG